MPSYDHTELLALVRELSTTEDESHLRWCIQECHNGRLHGPIDQKNLHLFRRYRNDPKNGSGNAQVMIDDALDKGERCIRCSKPLDSEIGVKTGICSECWTQDDEDDEHVPDEEEKVYRIQVNVASDKDDDTWSGNAITWTDPGEAETAAKDLYMRWTQVNYWRVIDEDDKVINSNK
jgi:hypothetical protein